MVILIISRLLGQVAYKKGIRQWVSFFLRVVKRKPNKTNQSCGSNPV
nr:MAG TPA: hypothetical protein [Caudoviricetes sp.]